MQITFRKKLDQTLLWLYKNRKHDGVTDEDIQKALFGGEMTMEYRDVINQITDDGLLHYQPINGTSNPTRFTMLLNHKGKIFHESGGYDSKNFRDTRNSILKTVQIIALIITSLATVWYARLSYNETILKDTLEEENKALRTAIKEKDSVLLESTHQVLLLQSAQRALQIKIDSCIKIKH